MTSSSSHLLTDTLKPNTMLYFPVVQECEQGVSRWIDIPADGAGHSHDGKSPAPGVKLSAKARDAPARRARDAAARCRLRDRRLGACVAGRGRAGDGSVLASAPKAVELRFNEAVTPGAIRLIDGAGKARDDARVSASGETISVAMPADLPQGTAGRQLSRDLAGRPSGRGIADLFDRHADGGRNLPQTPIAG